MANARRSTQSASAASYAQVLCRRSDRPQAWREPARFLFLFLFVLVLVLVLVFEEENENEKENEGPRPAA